MQTSHPTARYTAVAWVSAVLIGVAAGIALGFLLRDAWAGVITGVVVVVLIGFSAVLAARRTGPGTVEGAPPWTGDAGARHIGGGGGVI